MAYSIKGNPHRELPKAKKSRVKKDGKPVVAPVEETVVVEVQEDEKTSENGSVSVFGASDE